MSPEGSLANVFIRLSASVTEYLVLRLFTSELHRPPTPQASLAARPGVPHLREGHRRQPVPGFCQKVAEGTVTKKIHNLIFPVVWNRQRCVTGCGTASLWPPNSAWTSAVRSSSLWSPVPVTPETTAHQNSKCRETKSKQSFYLILAANIRDLHGSCHRPSDRFARPRNKPYRPFLHHWNKRRILPSGKVHIAMKEILEDIWHPYEEGCVCVYI